MIIDFYVAYSDDIVPKILERELPDGVCVSLYDEQTRTGKKNAWALKSEWGARENPFILVTVDGKPNKAFYSEAEKDVVLTALNYLKNELLAGVV